MALEIAIVVVALLLALMVVRLFRRLLVFAVVALVAQHPTRAALRPPLRFRTR